ncbi:carbohydrate ABC transporter, N-acetylglucosamine/diacetylchitobiose-binding protein [Actinoplanes lobatus]|uniref:Carbohydrate ABC transporter, N-acetylglucosamine/diacetylchitobiose-binding protein n=1 Tax=Actinoplanes lobatus TaxID=113568 RepID=A0A7W7HFM0_9ACTN|nr:N-acetylglucosamine/diacetylchitobiose ABC transporter substrate-binding protein [Actinoplanes lobatus]MBB4749649.1 N-acetylglucosamine transport system substrate-binding protein [Actinoplanes lobatus]GGN75569.1 carbohydrate ABC transporter, N-acetylglucosamine/diacetylchitobiose-binding protein [Actinoplanes lobatus]GIE38388.1 carbohydrate ABC transporter, N-acetylglucosamine/diacetylchitobiose-binding protein [Actinoplanes lobatus]
MSDITNSELDRRTLLRRAAAVGLAATPAVGMLSACVGGGEEDTTDQATGTKSADNPLGVDPKAPIEIVIFDGGLGTKYATDVDTPLYNKKWPESKVAYSATQEISTTVQPRLNAGDAPDMINNSGAKMMDFGAIVAAGQAQDLTELYAAPSFDIPGKTVAETLVPGTAEWGSYTGKPYALNYSYTVFGLWHNATLFEKNGWALPATWAEFTALCDKIQAAGIVPFGYAGANAAYYMVRALLTSAGKIGTEQVLKDIDNLKPGAWTAPAVLEAAKAWGEIGKKYLDKSFLGLKHTEVQLQQNQDKVAFYPCGSWLENEQAKDTPPTFKYAVAPYPSVTTSDKLPAAAMNAAAGEIYFASSKGKNPRGGMEYLRVMLSKEAATEFTKLTKSLTVVLGAADGVELSPGLTSANAALTKAGKDVFMGYLFDTWYKKLGDESLSAVNDLMFKGGDAQKFCDRMEAASQALAKDSSVQKQIRS